LPGGALDFYFGKGVAVNDGRPSREPDPLVRLADDDVAALRAMMEGTVRSTGQG
jgi:hypothetical protein